MLEIEHTPNWIPVKARVGVHKALLRLSLNEPGAGRSARARLRSNFKPIRAYADRPTRFSERHYLPGAKKK